MGSFLRIFSLAGLLIGLCSSPLQAADVKDVDATTQVVDSLTSEEINYQQTGKQLTEIENTLKSGQISREDISAKVKYLVDIRSRIADAKKQSEKALEAAQKRLELLGEAPKEGETELEVITQRRKEFSKEEAFQKAQVTEADILLAKIDELDVLIVNVRNKELIGNLLVRQEPLIYPNVFFSSTKIFVQFFFDIIKSPIVWYQEIGLEKQHYVKSNLIPVAFLVLFSLWLGVYLRLWIMRKFGYKKDIEHPRYGTKVSAAIFVAVAYGVIPATIIAGFMIWMYTTKVMNIGFFGLVINSFLYYSLYVLLANAISRVLFAPYNEKWRLVNVSTDKAKRVTAALYFTAVIIGVGAFFEHVAVAANYSLELISFISALSSGGKGFCIVLILKRLLWDDVAAPEETEEGVEVEDDEEISSSFKVIFFTSLFSLGVFALAIFGYPKLSSFIFNRVILSVLIIGVFLIIRKTFNEAIHRLLLLRFWVRTFKLRRRLISRLDFWSSLVVDPLLGFGAIFSILSVWGVSTDLLIQSIKKIFLGFKIGGVEISLLSIIIGIIAFFIAITLVKSLRVRLMNNVLNKIAIDDGIKHSLDAGFGFLGYVISFLLAIAIMGGNLTNLALVAGALSVGIGLGLQNVVNNFVSGIILLFERPIKVGDWVIINGEEGRVKQINIRSTEVETFRKASVIIPNANLLSTTVTNLTHSNNAARLAVTVGVAYGSDTRLVEKILLECANAHKRVQKKPEPYVVFKDFGASSLEFELRCYTTDIWNGWSIPSDLRYEINRRFAEEGIEIPFPQMVIHSGDKVADKSQFYALKRQNTLAKKTKDDTNQN